MNLIPIILVNKKLLVSPLHIVVAEEAIYLKNSDLKVLSISKKL